MYLRKQGPAVTAADIVPPSGVVQPGSAHRVVERRGQARDRAGRRTAAVTPALQNKQAGAEIGRIHQRTCSPVLKVTHKVEATCVEQRTDFDKLVLDVETKPPITEGRRRLGG